MKYEIITQSKAAGIEIPGISPQALAPDTEGIWGPTYFGSEFWYCGLVIDQILQNGHVQLFGKLRAIQMLTIFNNLPFDLLFLFECAHFHFKTGMPDLKRQWVYRYITQ
jgi:hypothetical protein